jgi:hypothetical protein
MRSKPEDHQRNARDFARQAIVALESLQAVLVELSDIDVDEDELPCNLDDLSDDIRDVLKLADDLQRDIVRLRYHVIAERVGEGGGAAS